MDYLQPLVPVVMSKDDPTRTDEVMQVDPVTSPSRPRSQVDNLSTSLVQDLPMSEIATTTTTITTTGTTITTPLSSDSFPTTMPISTRPNTNPNLNQSLKSLMYASPSPSPPPSPIISNHPLNAPSALILTTTERSLIVEPTPEQPTTASIIYHRSTGDPVDPTRPGPLSNPLPRRRVHKPRTIPTSSSPTPLPQLRTTDTTITSSSKPTTNHRRTQKLSRLLLLFPSDWQAQLRTRGLLWTGLNALGMYLSIWKGLIRVGEADEVGEAEQADADDGDNVGIKQRRLDLMIEWMMGVVREQEVDGREQGEGGRLEASVMRPEGEENGEDIDNGDDGDDEQQGRGGLDGSPRSGNPTSSTNPFHTPTDPRPTDKPPYRLPTTTTTSTSSSTPTVLTNPLQIRLMQATKRLTNQAKAKRVRKKPGDEKVGTGGSHDRGADGGDVVDAGDGSVRSKKRRRMGTAEVERDGDGDHDDDQDGDDDDDDHDGRASTSDPGPLGSIDPTLLRTDITPDPSRQATSMPSSSSHHQPTAAPSSSSIRGPTLTFPPPPWPYPVLERDLERVSTSKQRSTAWDPTDDEHRMTTCERNDDDVADDAHHDDLLESGPLGLIDPVWPPIDQDRVQVRFLPVLPSLEVDEGGDFRMEPTGSADRHGERDAEEADGSERDEEATGVRTIRVLRSGVMTALDHARRRKQADVRDSTEIDDRMNLDYDNGSTPSSSFEQPLTLYLSLSVPTNDPFSVAAMPSSDLCVDLIVSDLPPCLPTRNEAADCLAKIFRNLVQNDATGNAPSWFHTTTHESDFIKALTGCRTLRLPVMVAVGSNPVQTIPLTWHRPTFENPKVYVQLERSDEIGRWVPMGREPRVTPFQDGLHQLFDSAYRQVGLRFSVQLDEIRWWLNLWAHTKIALSHHTDCLDRFQLPRPLSAPFSSTSPPKPDACTLNPHRVTFWSAGCLEHRQPALIGKLLTVASGYILIALINTSPLANRPQDAYWEIGVAGPQSIMAVPIGVELLIMHLTDTVILESEWVHPDLANWSFRAAREVIDEAFPSPTSSSVSLHRSKENDHLAELYRTICTVSLGSYVHRDHSALLWLRTPLLALQLLAIDKGKTIPKPIKDIYKDLVKLGRVAAASSTPLKARYKEVQAILA